MTSLTDFHDDATADEVGLVGDEDDGHLTILLVTNLVETLDGRDVGGAVLHRVDDDEGVCVRRLGEPGDLKDTHDVMTNRTI